MPTPFDIIRAQGGTPRPRSAALLAGMVIAGAGLGACSPAWARGAVGPTCTPHRLDISQIAPGTNVQVSPAPGVRDASPATQISFLGARRPDIGSVRISGSRSGRHTGRLVSYSQNDGASFLPSRGFVAGETVRVSAHIRTPERTQTLAYRFVVAHQDVLSRNPRGRRRAGGPRDVLSFRSRPDLHPSAVAVTGQAQGAGGDIFLAPYSGPSDDGPMILDAAGRLVWFRPMRPGTEAADFHVQMLRGQPVLTWWQGFISDRGFGVGEHVIYDGSYRKIGRVRAGNGYSADLHDLRITSQGTALITVYNPILCNLSSVGAAADGAVTDSLFEEVDVATGLVRQEWHSLDHVALGETHQVASKDTKSYPFDFFHINSIDVQNDKSVLISARSTWAAYDVDHRTGGVAWRLGGKRSSFAMGPGTQTAWQHDARELPDGTISIFDNGATPRVHAQSRAIVVRIDRAGATATLVRAYTHNAPHLLSGSQGNAQLLAGGDTFIGWGSERYFSEYSPTGELVLDGRLPRREQSYRAFRGDWVGVPLAPPALTARRTPRGLIVYASLNGATEVAHWFVLAGSTPSSLAPVALASWRGFETAIHTSSFARYIAVLAVDGAGQTVGRSPTIKP